MAEPALHVQKPLQEATVGRLRVVPIIALEWSPQWLTSGPRKHGDNLTMTGANGLRKGWGSMAKGQWVAAGMNTPSAHGGEGRRVLQVVVRYG